MKTALMMLSIIFVLSAAKSFASEPTAFLCMDDYFKLSANFEKKTVVAVERVFNKVIWADTISKVEFRAGGETNPPQTHIKVTFTKAGVFSGVISERMISSDKGPYKIGKVGTYQGVMSSNEVETFDYCELHYK